MWLGSACLIVQGNHPTVTYQYCKKKGHKATVCRSKKRGLPPCIPAATNYLDPEATGPSEELQMFTIGTTSARSTLIQLSWGTCVLVPKLQGKVLNEQNSNYLGKSHMKSLARTYVWWPGLDRDIKEITKGCTSCQTMKDMPAVAPFHPWSWPVKAWQRVHIDFASPFQGKMYLVMVAHSKWPKVFQVGSTLPTVASLSMQQQAQQVCYLDVRAEFVIGQEIWAQNSRHGPKWSHGVVVKLTGPHSHSVKLTSGVFTNCHIDYLHFRQTTVDNPKNSEHDSKALLTCPQNHLILRVDLC